MATASRNVSSKSIVVGYIGLGGTHEPCDTLLAFKKTFRNQLLLFLSQSWPLLHCTALGKRGGAAMWLMRAVEQQASCQGTPLIIPKAVRISIGRANQVALHAAPTRAD